MLRLRSVVRRSKTIVNSTYCHFLFNQLTYYVCQIIYIFTCSDPSYYFRFVGLLVQYIIIVVDLFHNSIHTCILFSSRFSRVRHLKIIHVDAS